MHDLELPPDVMAAALEQWGSEAEERIRANPYCLAGICSWWIIEDLRGKTGVRWTKTQRLGGALLDGIATVMQEHGHTVVDRDDAEAHAAALLQIRPAWAEVWSYLLDDGLVEVRDGDGVQLPFVADCERYVSSEVLRLAEMRFEEPGEDHAPLL